LDAPEAKESSFLAGLFGFVRPDRSRRPEDFTNGLMASVQAWLAGRPGWGWRIYRTKAGVRLPHLPTAQPDRQCGD
jgi:hypothetical protein